MKKRQTILMMALAVLLGTVLFSATTVQAASVRLAVKGEVERDQESTKDETEKTSTKTKTKSETYALEIQVSNTGKQDATYDLEWYFLSRPLNSNGDEVLCEKGKETLNLAGQQRVSKKVTSKTLSNREIQTSKTSSKSNGSGSSSSKSISGSVYAGYVVLVRQDGNILANQSNQKKYTTEEYLTLLEGPVKRPASVGSASSKKKKGKKK